MTWELPITGGCSCGAIRYESTEPPVRSAMCHCRMCQRWIGAPAAMGVLFDLSTLRFTKGKPKTFMTSAIMERSFCGDCGSPIMSRHTVPPYGPNSPHVAVGTLDHPEATEAPSLTSESRAISHNGCSWRRTCPNVERTPTQVSPRCSPL